MMKDLELTEILKKHTEETGKKIKAFKKRLVICITSLVIFLIGSVFLCIIDWRIFACVILIIWANNLDRVEDNKL